MVSCWQTLFWRLAAVLKNIILFVLLERRSTHLARITFETIILDKVFKNGPSKICRRQPLKNLKWYGRPYHFKYFKGCSTNCAWSILEYFVPVTDKKDLDAKFLKYWTFKQRLTCKTKPITANLKAQVSGSPSFWISQ